MLAFESESDGDIAAGTLCHHGMFHGNVGATASSTRKHGKLLDLGANILYPKNLNGCAHFRPCQPMRESPVRGPMHRVEGAARLHRVAEVPNRRARKGEI